MSSTLIAQLRRDLVTSSFSVETVGDLWGDEAAAALFRGQRLPALRALQRRRREGVALSRAETLAALFVLNVPVDRSAVDAALPTLTAAGAEQLGLTAAVRAGSPGDAGDTPGPDGAEGADGAEAPDDGRAPDGAPSMVRALLDLRPYSFVDSFGAGSWWILSDLGEVALGRALDEDHVLGVGGASLTLSGLMINTPVDRVLDLGTGCGIQALHASRHARQVIATDISERALWLAGLNADLNAIDNVEFRLGSLFEPVQGELFDQIVSNPPFVITPRQEGVPLYEYRDAGMVGDALVATVIRGSEAHLTPGGVAQLLGNWEYREQLDGLDRVRGWLAGTELDAWVIERELQDAPLYAETWIRDGGTRQGTAEFDALYAAWLDDFDARGVTHVGFGYVLLRRPAAAERGGASGGARGGAAGGGASGGAGDVGGAAGVVGGGAAGGGAPAGSAGGGAGGVGGAPGGAGGGGAGGGAAGRVVGDAAGGVVGGTAGGFVGGAAAKGALAGARLRRFESLDGARGANPAGLGEYFAAALAGHDWQSSRSDDALLASTVVYASDVTEERHYWPGQENPTVMTLRQGTGFARTVSLDTALAALVGACDGDLTIGQICGAIAHLLEVDELELLVDVLPRMRALIDDGFLLPHEG